MYGQKGFLHRVLGLLLPRHRAGQPHQARPVRLHQRREGGVYPQLEHDLSVALGGTTVLHGVSLSIASTDPLDEDYLSKIAELARELAGALCLVQPSEWYENLPLSVLEALAHGTPVLATARSAVLLDHCRRSNAGLWYENAAEFGEALCAAVQPATPDAGLNADAVRAFLHERIAGYKVPRLVAFHDALPREDSGKIFKRRLKAPYWEKSGRRI